jgi:hypothetical protein
MLTSDEERPTTVKTEADLDPFTSQGHESSQEPTLSAARSWLDLVEEIQRAGGAAGDLCISIDGAPAAQVVAEWEDGSRPRRAGEAITVELERLGKRLTIHARWRDIPSTTWSPWLTEQFQQVDEGADATVQPPLFTRPSPFQNLPALPPDHKRERPANYSCAVEWNPFREPPD